MHVQIMSDGCQKYQTSTCSEFVFSDLIDVMPKATRKPGMGTPAKFESFDETMERLSKNPPSELRVCPLR